MRGYVPNFAEFAAEGTPAVDRARRSLLQGTPISLLGESMGGMSILQALMNEAITPRDIRGIILCGALVRIAPELLPPSFLLPLLKLMAWSVPKMPTPGEQIAGETFEQAIADRTVAPWQGQIPLVLTDAPARFGMAVGALTAMGHVTAEGAELIKVRWTVRVKCTLRTLTVSSTPATRPIQRSLAVSERLV